VKVFGARLNGALVGENPECVVDVSRRNSTDESVGSGTRFEELP
jgi:hypothetical protein